jgi:hypothetical protein
MIFKKPCSSRTLTTSQGVVGCDRSLYGRAGRISAIRFTAMDPAPKLAPRMRRLVALAYTNGSTPKRRPYRRYDEKQSIPGPLFDIAVVGMFLILGGSYIVSQLWTS